MDPIAASVLDALDGLVPDLVADTSRLVQVPSVGGTTAEHDAQALVAGWLEADGLEVDHWRIDVAELAARPDFCGMEVARAEAWGVVGRVPGTGGGTSLLLDGHVDVVPVGDPAAWHRDPFSGAVADGRLHGRGACDMKAGVVATRYAIAAVRAAGVELAGDVLFASVVGEEDGGLGTYALLDRGWRADASVIAEPTELDIIPANAGALTFRLTVRGLGTHAARRTDGVSAIEKFAVVQAALAELERRRHRHVDPVAQRWALAHPLSIGTVRAGDWASSVPDVLVAEGRLGVAIGEDVAHARAEFETAIADACRTDAWLADHPVEVEWWGGQFASGRLPTDSDLIDRVAAAHRTAAGMAPDVYGAPYGSDLRLLVGAGIPTVQYGPGDAAVAHGPDEWVAIADVVTAARTLALVLLDVCGTPRPD